jgi:hypothetical protein
MELRCLRTGTEGAARGHHSDCHQHTQDNYLPNRSHVLKLVPVSLGFLHLRTCRTPGWVLRESQFVRVVEMTSLAPNCLLRSVPPSRR